MKCVRTKFEDEVFVKELFVAPENPPETRVDETEFVPGRVNGNDTRDVEGPFEFRIRKGRDEAAGRSVNVNRDVETFLFLKFVHFTKPIRIIRAKEREEGGTHANHS